MGFPCFPKSPSEVCIYTQYTNTILHTDFPTAAVINGDMNVVKTLLLHCTHADRADKHGVMPEMPTQENGKEGMAGVLQEWLVNKDQVLREHKGGVGSREEDDTHGGS